MCFDLTFRETKLNSARKALVLLKFELAEAQGAVVFVTYLKFFVSPTCGIIILLLTLQTAYRASLTKDLN